MAARMNFELMLHQASAMLGAADRVLFEEAGGDGTNFPIEALIFTSLSAEIALKAGVCKTRGISEPRDLMSLIRATGNGPSAHDLAAIFSLLSAHEQAALREDVIATIPQTQGFLGTSDQGELQEFPPVTFSPSMFQARLDSVRRCFEDWRYSYEPPLKIVNLTFLQCLARSSIALFTPRPA